MIIEDKGCTDPKVIHEIQLERFERPRHEHINKRLRHFGVLRDKFVHNGSPEPFC